MDFNEIKEWLSYPAERFVFIEDGKPAFVAMGFEAYRGLRAGLKPNPSNPGRAKDTMELVNANLEAERLRARELATKLAMSEPRPVSQVVMSDAEDMPRVRLEDLPL